MQRASQKRLVALFLCLQQVFLFYTPLLAVAPTRVTQSPPPLPRAWLPFVRPSLPPGQPSPARPLVVTAPPLAASASEAVAAAESAGTADAIGAGAEEATASDCHAPANAIVDENCKTGDTDWQVNGPGDSDILGFATEISVNRGDPVAFKINTPSTDYRIDIYRMGYYGGAGARKVATIQPSVALPQVQPACLTDAPTGLIDCGNWQESASWSVPANATSGIYFARPVREDQGVDPNPSASHIPFVVRDDDGHSALLFQTSDTTWEAYNNYGGNSLYEGNPPVGRAYKVSYNRPFVTRTGNAMSYMFNGEYPMVRWLERNGYDVSYFTGVDSDRRGSKILEHKVFMSVGHDEYWSGQQRTNIENARNAGVHLTFFSGNESFWKTRWEASIDGTSTAYRTLVTYKETHANAKIDPDFPSIWTGTWRDPRFSPPADGGRPENALTGTLFQVNGYENKAIKVTQPEGRLRFWRNTAASQLEGSDDTLTLPTGTLGYEWDEAPDDASRPPGLVNLTTAEYAVAQRLQDYGSTYAPGTATHHATLYRHGNTLVFSAGTVQWSWGLDSNHDFPAATASLAMQQATLNLLADMGVQPTTMDAGLVPASASSDTTAPSSTILAPTAGTTLASGTPVTISGTAGDTGGLVAGVEVSVDGGVTWNEATGHENWTYSWTPLNQGSFVIRSRATDDSGNLEAPGAGVSVEVGVAAPYSCPCSIWTLSTTPALASNTDAQPVELGVRFRSQVSGFITGIRFYKGALNTGPHVGHLWTDSGTMLGEATFTTETATGWQRVTFDTPVAISAETTYVASYYTASGQYAVDRPYFDVSGHLNPPLEALQDGVSGANGVFIYPQPPAPDHLPGAFPTLSFQSTNYWVDVEFATGVQNPPTAAADSYSVDEDAILTVPAPGVLANDTDPDSGASLSALLVSPTSHGALVLSSNGGFSYTPQANFNGTDSFTYRASDGNASSAAATVTITVNPVNDLPTAVNDSYVVAEDTTLTIGAPGVVANDTDVDNTTLSANLVAPPAHGALTLNANGSFSYTPSTNFNGTDTFTYRAGDGVALSNTATVSIVVTPVNDPPSVNAGPDQTVTLPATVSLAGAVTDDSVFTSVWGKVSGPGTVAFANPNAPATTATITVPGVYELALTASDGQFIGSDSVTVTVNAPAPPSSGLKFDGVNDYVTFGAAAGTTKLGATVFTLETWFKKDGPGVTASTGTGGLTAVIPLVTKGVAQADGSNLDANYFLGIDSKTRTIAADFEDTATGLNHPVMGTTLIADGLWYHAAATYDGTTWRLYLNGVLETTLVVGNFTPRSDSIQHAGLGSAINSGGIASGFFQGSLDEARIWNVARSATDIQAAMGTPISTPTAGLIGRWGLDEGTGTTAADSSGRGDTGTLTGGVAWVPGTPFVFSPWPAGNFAVKMTGSVAINDYGTLGPAPALGASTFTIETWFRRDGAGVSTSTGSTGIDAIPLVTKGRAEGEASNVDMNYFLGIRATDGVLVADFEEGATGVAPGANHPIVGTTPIAIAPANPTAADWHHGAVTYDGTTLRLYLDGNLQSSVVAGQPPRADSIQHAGLGTAFNSTGVAAGFFAGVLDEARVWNYARSAAQIATGRTRPIAAAAGLLGRWGFDDGFGIVHDSSGNNQNGTMSQGTGWTWVPGAPFTNTTNTAPVVNAGPDVTVTMPAAATLSGSATDDGIVNPLVTTWSKTSGPGTVAFANPNAASTTATFSIAGTYVLTLTANDGELVSTDTVTVVVSGVVNLAPVVDAGPDQTITVPASSASLVGTATDDGLPTGTLTKQWTKVSGPGTVTFGDATALATTATFTLQGAYVLRLTANDSALSTSDTVTITVDSSPANKAIDFGGTNAYVTLGPAPGLGATKFTLETWFRRDGAGVATFTGTGGVTAIPLVTKGMAEVDNSDNKDMNYFLGIRQTDGVLVADFEDTVNGGNHPIAGVTVIPADGAWRHAAATYDGTTWRLYLNGVQDASLVVGAFSPRADSIQHAALGGALNSTGGVGTQPQGFFDGALDEARIWNYARTTPQIAVGRTHEIATAPGLLGRWGFNEISGTVVADSSGHGINGTVAGTAFTRVAGAPFSTQGNTAPTAVADTATTPQNTAASIAVLANDTDADGDVLSVVSVVAPAHGSAVINANGTITYTPAAAYSGADSFSYTISDNQGGSATSTVSVTITVVNVAPVANTDTPTVAEDTATPIAVLANDTDADGDVLSITAVSVPAHGTAAANPDKTITYTPALNYNGADSFTYTISDGHGGTATGTVNVTVTAVNDNPVAVNDTAATNEDTPVTIPVLANDTDVDTDTLTVSSVGAAAHGGAVANGDGTITYTPATNYNGPDTFSYTIGDGHGGTATGSVNVTVAPVNDAAVAVADAFTTPEDQMLIVEEPGVLANDNDADGDTLMTIPVTEPSHGSLTMNSDGSFIYSPDENFNGVDTFTYMVSDGIVDGTIATVTLTVTPVNDAPVAVNDTATTLEDTAVSGNVLTNDSDVDTGTTLTATLVANVSHGTLTLAPNGAFTYTPNANYNGSDSFTYTAGDGTEASNVATVAITVTPVNDAPVASDDTAATAEDTAVSGNVLTNDSDVDTGTTLAATLVTNPANGTLTLASNGAFTYTPNANFNGSDSFTYKANDGILDSNVATVVITVTGVNDAPVAVNDAVTTAEDTAVSGNALANDTDVDAGTTLTAALVASVSNGTLALAPNGDFTYTPNANFNGSDSFTYTASDGVANSNVATVTITITAVNDAPVANDQAVATDEDTAKAITLIAADTEGSALTYAIVTPPAHGTLTGTAPAVTYTPNANYNGPDSFTFKANDGTVDSNVATVTVTVAAVNDAPVANDQAVTTDEDTAKLIALSATDTELSPLTYTIVTPPAHGTLTGTAPAVTYTPAANYNGPDSFTFRANDGTADSNVATVTITVAPVNDAPVALNDTATTLEDTAVSGNVLGNDTDIDAATTLTATLVANVQHGTLTLASTGGFTYTPAANFNGSDSFTYTASDGTATSNVATVTITVTAVNDAPVAVNDTVTTAEDTAASGNVLANDTDVDAGTTLTATLVATASHGTLGLASNGDFTYTPAANYNGPDSFTYTASDGTATSNVATVTITVTAVNDAPVASDQSVTTDEDTAKSITLSATDVEVSALTYTIVTPPAHGTLSGTAPGVTYTPNANYNGPDSFTFKANDGTVDSNVATVTITVTAVNDAPVAGNDNYNATEDTALTIAAPGVLVNDTDVDGTSLTAAVVTQPAHGSVALAPNGGFVYTPALNYNGTDSFTYKANDGTADSNVATVTITIAAVNDAPVAVNDAVTTPEDTGVGANVLTNDSDVDAGTTLTATLVANVSHGTLALASNGDFTYTPAANYNGSDSFTYTANDGTAVSNVATVTITVTAVNDAPVADDQAVTTDEDTAKSIALTATDTEGSALTYTIVTPPAHGTLSGTVPAVIYTPAANYNGPDSFTFKANDGTVDSNVATVTITVTAVNDAPVAVNDTATTPEDTAVSGNVLGNDTDVDAATTLTATLVANVSHGTLALASNGGFTYTPDANFNGSDSFTYTAGDGTALSNVATVTITVTAVNDAPVAVNDTVTTLEDTAVSGNVLANDTDVDAGTTLTAALVANVAHGTLALAADGSFTYTPTANYNGSDSFTYTASDGTALSNVATVTITVTAVNDAPVAGSDSYSGTEDTPLVVAGPGVLVNDTDADGNPLTVAVVTQPTHGTVVLAATGGFTYTPALNYNGSDSFTYRANDGTADSNVATVSMTLTAVNDAPIAANDSFNTTEDTPLTIPAAGVLGNDTDVDGNPLTAIVLTQPAHGAVTLNTNGSFTYTSVLDFNGTDSFTYKANDGTADSNAATVTITVGASNDAPVAVNDAYSTAEDTPLTVASPGVVGNDTDEDFDTLTAILGSQPAHGTVTLGTNGGFTYTPNANYNGTDSFTYKASDGATTSSGATVTITVTAVNDVPVASDQAVATDEDTAKAITLSASDVELSPLTYTIVTLPVHGTLSGTAPAVTYTPAANYNGSDSFTFKANDGTADSNVATVTVTVAAVNDAPVALSQAVTTDEDTAKAIGLSASDTEGSSLTYTIVTLPAHGTLSGTAPGVTYTPAANYNGLDSFTFKANDGTADSNVATVTITVTAVNDAPVASDQAVTTDEDTAKSIALTASDTEGSLLTYTIVTAPAHGSLSGTAPAVTYTPNANYNGPDSFTFKANDGTADSNVATVTVTVTSVNDAPVATDQSVTTAEDTAKGITLGASDTEGSGLTYTIVTLPAHGTLSGTAPALTYTPAANYNGPDNFTFKANDGTVDSNVATVTITVTAVNDAPVALNDTATTPEDTAVSGNVLTNDTDVDAATTLTATLVANVQHGTLALASTGGFTYTPAANYNGSDSFTYTASDGTATSNVATVTITVTAVNDAPVAVNDAVTTPEDTAVSGNVLTNDTDADAATTLNATLVANVSHGSLTLAANGAFTYTPAANYNGPDSFTYTASDGLATSNVATVTITVTAVNDAPVANDQPVTTDEDTGKAIVLTATDTEGSGLTYTIVTLPAHGTLSGTAPTVTYTPAANYNGPDSFTFKANDGTADSNAATVTITVTAVNDAPVAVNDTVTTPEDTAVSGNVLSNDTDADAATTLTATLVANVSHGTLTLAPNGGFTYTPNANYNGPDSFTYTAGDGTALSNVATVTITVTAVNDAPVALNDSYSATEDTALTIAAPGVLGNDSDVDLNPLTAAVVAQPAHGTVTVNATGGFTYTPAANYNGSDSFTYKANDGTADSNIATVTITVAGTNDAPVAVSDSYNATEDTPLTIAAPGVLGNDSDVDLNPLTAAVVAQPAHGTVTVNATGGFTYTPALNYNGSDAFTYKANDGTVDSNVATVTITVAAANDAPVAANDSYNATEDTPLTIAAPGLLGNDSDVDGNPLTAAVVAQPAHGTVTVNANGSFTYTPAGNYNGSDSFTYKANDGTVDSSVAAVTITIAAVNDAPVVSAGPDLSVSIPAGASLNGTATDPDGPSLTITWSQVSGPGTTTFGNANAAVTTATFSAPGTYVLRLTGSDGQFTIFDDATITASTVADMALKFDGVNDYVTFGQASGPSGLGATTFTLETWFKREGAGIATSTGTGGLIAVPLITKGMAQADGSNLDMNYFLGLDPAKRVLVADFEDMATGGNHPVAGVTPISDGIWYHAAVSYDGTTWRLYLNGVLETQLVVGSFTPRSDSIQHAAIGTALGSGGTVPSGQTAGAFAGSMDEVRIWSVARSAAEIQGAMGSPLTGPATGLLGRWSLNESVGTTAADTSGRGMNGTWVNGPVAVTGSGYTYTPLPPGNYGLHLTGTTTAGDYVALGPAPGLNAATFTIETWFKRDGAGVSTSTGTTGIDAIPLVTKGRAEAEGSNVDMNYFLGIRASDGVLAADFEDMASGGNHPIVGTTVIQNNIWYHAAATYDGTTWRLYLNGVQDASVVVGAFTPRSDSIQHAGLGTAFNSTGVAAGFFAGTLDESRIWNVARSASQILGSKDQEITGAASGLLARWGFNVTTGQVLDTSGNNRTGTLTGTSWAWTTPGAPVSAGASNTAPVVNAGSDQSVALAVSAALSGTATDDGLPGSGLTTTWSKTSGPGSVSFGNAAALSTSATFSAVGTYVLTLTANDGALSSSDDVTITVTTGNLPPSVNAGADQSITLPTNVASLTGTATDDGLPGAGLTTQWTKVSGPGTVSFGNAAALSTSATFSAAGTYVLQLSASDSLLSATDTMSVVVNASATDRALTLGGTNAYVTFGAAPGLAASTFTIETWFRRDGAGIATSTGTGGVVAVPLVTKGMAETETAATDMNYFLGIRQSDGVLVADFEDTNSSLNHPVAGTTVIPSDGVWRHAAATYDGTTWRIFLNGALEAQLVVGNFTPQSAGTQHAALGTALNSTGGVGSQTQGFFNGALDEARIWNYARSQQQVARGRQFEITTAPGLLGRWGLNATSGTSVADSSGHGITGTLVGSNFTWSSPGAPFSGPANSAPVGVNDTASMNRNTAATISVLANDVDADGDLLTVTIGTAPAHGSASVNPNGTVLYTPALNYEGGDSFAYSISDNQGGTGAATVTLTISGVANTAPVVNAGPDQTITLPVNVASLSGTATDDGVPGVGVTTQWTKVSGPGTVTFGNAAALSTTATFSSGGSYVLQLSASDSVLLSVDTIVITVNANPANKGIDFGGTNAYVTFGAAPGLGVTTMTLETWFKRDGTGIATNTGTGGVVAVPLVTKGMAETEGGVVDMNYFLGIRGTDNVLVADFEDAATGANHPVAGTTAIPADGTWRHVAATYDGTTWRLYLNGALEAQLVVGSFTPQSASIQHAALGTALNSTGGVGSQTQGFFDGELDEARIWNYARSAQQVGHGRQLEITSAPGLRGRWGMNEGSGSVVGDSSGNGITGTLVGSNVAWAPGAPFSGSNGAPVAVNDSATTPESTGVTITVLANDTDPDGDALVVASVGSAAHGTALLNANGTVTYTPVAGFNGSDSFSYTVSDGQGKTATGTVNVTITSVNEAPTVFNDSYSTNKNVTLVVDAPGVLGNDVDPDGDDLSVVGVTNPSHGDLTLGADGGFVYTPDAGYHGPDSFTYLANDDFLDSNVATVNLTVIQTNEAPVAVNDTGSANEDTALSVAAPGVLGNDTDADGNPLTAVVVSMPAHGSLTLNANGGYVYTPAGNYNGSDSFTYMANDGTANSNVATVSLSISAVNDAPVAIGETFSVNEDANLNVTAPGVLANDTDVEGDVLTAVLVSGPSHGTLTPSSNGSFSYTPAANYNGSDSFTYRANDGTADSNVATVTINIAPMPDAPAALNDSFSTNEDTTLVLFGPAVLANDSDIDGDALTAVLVTTTTHGTLSLNANGGFTYTPAVNYNGPDSFTYKANDGALNSNVATVLITVNPTNDAPVAVSNSYSTNEDTALVVSGPGVLANDTDVDGNPLTAILVTGTTHGTLSLGADGGFTYTPAANYNGPDSFTYRASDGVTTSNVVTVSLTINSVNDAPVAVADSYTTSEDTPLIIGAPGLLANDSDVEGSPLTAVKVANPGHGTVTVNANGSFTYTPTANYNGADSFTYRANDGSVNSATVTVSLTVTAVNDAPVATAQSRSLNEDATRSIVLAGTDVEGSALTFTIVTSPAHGVLIGTAPNVTYDPDPNYNGPDSFTFRVNDGSLNSAPATVSLTVTPINDAPVGQTASYTTPKNTAKENGTLVATDVGDGDTLTYSISTQGGKGTVTVNVATGAFTYTPNLNATGTDTFKFRASDGTTLSTATTITIVIQP